MAFKPFKSEVKDNGNNNEELPKDVIKNGCVCDFFVYKIKEMESKDFVGEDGLPLKIYVNKAIVNGVNDKGEKVMSFADFWINDWMSLPEGHEKRKELCGEMGTLAKSVGFGNYKSIPYVFECKEEKEYNQFITGKGLDDKPLKGKVKVRYWMSKNPLTGKYDEIIYQDPFNQYHDTYQNGDVSPKINYDLVSFDVETDLSKMSKNGSSAVNSNVAQPTNSPAMQAPPSSINKMPPPPVFGTKNN